LNTEHLEPLRKLDRRSWWLWAMAFCVMLALTASVPTLYFSLLAGQDGSQPQWLDDGYYVVVSLGGMVLVFCLYTVLKQRELNGVRHALLAEHRELEDVRTRLSELSALFHLSSSLNLQLQLDSILEIIVRRVVSTLRAQQASVMIYNPDSGLLETRAAYGLESEYAMHSTKRIGEGIAGWVAEHKQALLLGKDPPRGDLGTHYKAHRNITSALSLPLRAGDRCVGVLNVNRINHPEAFREHHREILRLFAEHVGGVIERAQTMDRLGTRALELEAANVKLAELNRMKDVFLSTASHELKTPLTSVIAYAELLDDGGPNLPQPQHREFLKRLRGEAQRLLGLIDDILDLSRLETGKLRLRREGVDLNAVVHQAVETTTPLAEKHHVTLLEDLGADLELLLLDGVKMRQVVINLLNNAVNFTPDGGTVRVSTRYDSNSVLLEVKDQGPGVSPEDSSQIFEIFSQATGSGPGRSVGTGIGLHLVKRLVELHGGMVGVSSAPGQGSTFWVRLPITLASAQDQRAAA
jgi:signal transduction histidine kinase